MIKIYDGMNYFRVQIESQPGALVPRVLYNKMCNEPGPHIWVWEGAGGNNRRRDKYPQYKMNREPTSGDLFAFVDHFKRILQCSPANQVAVPGYEGDDVMATLAKHYSAQGNKVAIYSNDFDLQQLSVDPNIICGSKPKEEIPPKHIRLYKALVGDSSDNIKGIPGFGAKAWTLCDKEIMEQICQSDGIVLDDIEKCNLTPRVKNWLFDHQDDLKVLYEIVGLYDVSKDDINENWVSGELNREGAEALLQEILA